MTQIRTTQSARLLAGVCGGWVVGPSVCPPGLAAPAEEIDRVKMAGGGVDAPCG